MGGGEKSRVWGGFGPRARLPPPAAPHRSKTMAEHIYLDWNATAPLRNAARAAAIAALEVKGNPSSVHGEGRAARRLIERARDQVAGLGEVQARNVVITSGGTQTNT